MIINVNSVNKDTNTMRTDTEINSLVDARTTNKTERVLLKTLRFNQTSLGGPFGSFSLNHDEIIKYDKLYFLFNGSLSATSSGGVGAAQLYLENDNESITLARSEAYANYGATMSGFTISLYGSMPSFIRSSDGATTASRLYYLAGSTSSRLTVDGSTMNFRLGGVNNISNASIDGTMYIYGIK